MELDTLIIYGLVFFFFVLPALLKRRKKTGASGQQKPAMGFGTLGEKLRSFLRELEKQALEAKKKAEQQAEARPAGRVSRPADKSIWELLDDRASAADVEAVPFAESEIRAAAVSDSPSKTEPVRRSVRKGRAETGKKVPRPKATVSAVPVTLPAHALQQAVVWSEILGPPKALKKD